MDHLVRVNKKASREVNVLSRITPYMNIAKRRALMNLFFTSQFVLSFDLDVSW